MSIRALRVWPVLPPIKRIENLTGEEAHHLLDIELNSYSITVQYLLVIKA